MLATFRRGTHPLQNELNKRVLSIASELNYKLYLVGGYVRDALMSNDRVKVPILTMRCSRAMGKNAQPCGSPLYWPKWCKDTMCRSTNQTILRALFLMMDKQWISLVVSGGSIECDVMRRDFSINALVWDPERADEIIDLVDGVRDLDSRCIRAISENSFKEDPLRMLRAFRFSATLGGVITEETLSWIRRHVSAAR